MLACVAMSVLASGCATKTTIHALEPAEVDRAASLKQVGVLEFDESKPSGREEYGINFASKLEALLASYQLDNENYFVVVSRSDLDRIIEEQKFQRSGLVDESKIAEIGQLAGAQALISGAVSSASSNDSSYRDRRTRSKCDSKGKNCKTIEYTVSCKARTIGLGVQVKMVDVQRGDLVTAESFDETKKWTECSDSSRTLPSMEQGLEELSNLIAGKFVSKITPRYISFEVTLIDDLDVELPETKEQRFDAAIEFIKADRMDRAGDLLDQLHAEVQQQSYAIAYNLGVVKESEGAYDEAKSLYNVADSLTLEPVEEINLAVQRIDRLIENNKRAVDQMSR